MSVAPVSASGTFSIGNELVINRLGFGAMRLTGDGIWGPPTDPGACRDVLRTAVDLGVNLIDTADSYGPHVSEELIAEALHPYPDGLVIATKAGLVRGGPNDWSPDGRPSHLREACEGSLRRLRLETIDLYQLHRIDPKVPAEEQIGTLLELRDEGRIQHIGLSEVTTGQLKQVLQTVEIATVQNRFNLTDRRWDDVVDVCTAHSIGFLPWFPMATGRLARPGGVAAEVVGAHRATPAQIALAWLLRRSPTMLPIPGTSSVDHLRENCDAARIDLSDDEFDMLSAAA
ncbi:MAG TPA: aldo/keto reductase [Euzebyales bacterium]|nr:aldo/keto reductase [Euzebyales bacterium]